MPCPWVGLARGCGGLPGVDDGALSHGDVDEGLVGSCCVAASVPAGGRGARDAVGELSWPGSGLGFGSGQGPFSCRRAFGDF